MQSQALISLRRLMPRVENRFQGFISEHPQQWQEYRMRVEEHFPRLFDLLLSVYGGQYDFFYHLEELLYSLTQAWIDRPADLKDLDARRLAHPGWFQSNQMLGGVLYVDLFAGNLEGVRSSIPYFKELGLTYLHLMPLFKVPDGPNDGGYAVSSYRDVDARLGTMQQLAALARDLRQQGISLVLDFIFNHTSDEHEWALKAKAGDPLYREYYRVFDDRAVPDAYERTLREIFPTEHPGAFTFNPEMNAWVWTTFHSYQWDLNYANPEVFRRMSEEVLYLANQGVEVLRLDAVAFIWKQIGTSCENLPEAHNLIQAFNAVMRIAAPSLLFKSEAIVHPDEVARYIHPGECQLSYNPLMMALLWNSLATRQVSLLRQALAERYPPELCCAWVNYVRCHDDIGWTFSDEDAARLGINGFDHRKFLNAFFTGRFEGSFARGLPFQENPRTGDARISGACASLAGLEKALREETPREALLAVRRILLMHGIVMTTGGIPLIYLGDELATLNDYDFRLDPDKVDDSRWVHRPKTDWERAARRHDSTTLEGQVFQGMQRLVQLRKETPVFSGGDLQVMETGNPYVLGYMRAGKEGRVLVFANFSEEPQSLPPNLVRLYGLNYTFRNLMTGQPMPPGDICLEGCDFLVVE